MSPRLYSRTHIWLQLRKAFAMTFYFSQAFLLAIALATSALSIVIKSPVSTLYRHIEASDCVAFYHVASGDHCLHIQEIHGDTFTMEELYKWNPQINRNCTNLKPGETICIRELRKDDCDGV